MRAVSDVFLREGGVAGINGAKRLNGNGCMYGANKQAKCFCGFGALCKLTMKVSIKSPKRHAQVAVIAPNAHTVASVAVHHASVNLGDHTFQVRLHAHGLATHRSTLGAMHAVRTAATCKAVGMSIQSKLSCVLKGRECSEGCV